MSKLKCYYGFPVFIHLLSEDWSMQFCVSEVTFSVNNWCLFLKTCCTLQTRLIFEVTHKLYPVLMLLQLHCEKSFHLWPKKIFVKLWNWVLTFPLTFWSHPKQLTFYHNINKGSNSSFLNTLNFYFCTDITYKWQVQKSMLSLKFLRHSKVSVNTCHFRNKLSRPKQTSYIIQVILALWKPISTECECSTYSPFVHSSGTKPSFILNIITIKVTWT